MFYPAQQLRRLSVGNMTFIVRDLEFSIGQNVVISERTRSQLRAAWRNMDLFQVKTSMSVRQHVINTSIILYDKLSQKFRIILGYHRIK